MTPEFSGKQFGWQAARRAAIFLVLMFGVPLALYALDRSQGSDVSLNEAIRITTATFVGFYLYLIFILSMVRPSWRRMKSLRLPGYWGLIVPLLLFADIPYFIATRPDDSLGSSISTLDGRMPFYLLAAFSVVLAMIFARPPVSDEVFSRRFGFVGKGALLLAILIPAVAFFHVGMANWMRVVMSTLGSEHAPSQLFLQLTKNSYWVYVLNPYACGLFSALIVWCAVISRRSDRTPNI
jgi:hypothetical protein